MDTLGVLIVIFCMIAIVVIWTFFIRWACYLLDKDWYLHQSNYGPAVMIGPVYTPPRVTTRLQGSKIGALPTPPHMNYHPDRE